MGLFDFGKSDTETTEDDEDDEELTDKERGYRTVEKEKEQSIVTYEVEVGDETIRYNTIDRKENHVEFFDIDLYAQRGRYRPRFNRNVSLVAVVPWDNIDGALRPETVDETTYRLEYTQKQKWLSYLEKWNSARLLGMGDLEVVDEGN